MEAVNTKGAAEFNSLCSVRSCRSTSHKQGRSVQVMRGKQIISRQCTSEVASVTLQTSEHCVHAVMQMSQQSRPRTVPSIRMLVIPVAFQTFFKLFETAMLR